MELNRNGVLVRHNVELIGANAQAIAKGEDRQLFKEAMIRIGLDVAALRHRALASTKRARGRATRSARFPLIIRPAFTLGGTGGGIAYNREEFETIVERGLDLSPVSEVLIEESLFGWKEFEMEVMRDRADNCVIICSIENFDPMGVHTGDSITVAPAQTLTDREYQIMRDASFAVIREIGVETGGSNIQFAVNPGQRPHGRDRDEPARLALERAGLESDRFSDREDRGQARGRLHARRAPQRHHPRNAGELRADDRLLRGQDSALHLREIPAGRRRR